MTDNVPKNLPAERAVIGTCLLSSEAIGIVSEKLRPEDFYGQSNKKAYEICLEMYQAGKPVDLTTFQSEAISRKEFSRIGGQPYMAEVVGDAMAIGNVEYYAELVREASAFALNKGFLVPPFDALLILLVLIFSSLSNMSFPLYILPMTFFLSQFLKLHPGDTTIKVDIKISH